MTKKMIKDLTLEEIFNRYPDEKNCTMLDIYRTYGNKEIEIDSETDEILKRIKKQPFVVSRGKKVKWVEIHIEGDYEIHYIRLEDVIDCYTDFEQEDDGDGNTVDISSYYVVTKYKKYDVCKTDFLKVKDVLMND